MGFLSDVFELKKLSRQISKDAGISDSANMKTAAACWTKAKAISAQASKYVLEYPVACTNQIIDYNQALAITKQIEIDCARFVILASGLNPIVDRKNGDTIEAHLNQMVTSFESYYGVPCTIEPAKPEFIAAANEYMNNHYSTELYHTFKEDAYGTDRLSNSIEAIEKVNVATSESESEPPEDLNGNEKESSSPIDEYDADFERMFYNIHKDSFGENGSPYQHGDPTEAEFEEFYKAYTGKDLISPEKMAADKDGNVNTTDLAAFQKEYQKYYDKYAEAKKGVHVSNQTHFDTERNRDILKKIQENGPTIVTVTLYITDGAGGQRAILLPLAIKSTLQFVESPDLMRVLSGTESKSKSLAKFIKVTTGQMSFFKDWLFAITESDKDLEREQALGAVPIFRRLLDAKNRYRIKTIAASRPKLAQFIAGKTQKDLPMCTIVCTTTELEEAFKQKWTYIYKNRKHIDEVIDTYMLLGLGVVDQTSNIIYIFYAGEEEPQIMDIAKLGQGSVDSNKALADALSNMTRMMARH